MSTIEIGSDVLSVTVAAHYGARIVSLFDRRTGREWMTAGGESANVGEQAVYSGEEAVAWDECFPTVGTWDAGATPWRRRLRDHGDLWGRPWVVTRQTSASLTTVYRGSEFEFVRELTVEGNRLSAAYAATNLLSEPLPYLWAMHSLFAVQPGDRIELAGVDSVEASFMSSKGQVLADGWVPWSSHGDSLPFVLSEVQSPQSEFMGKFLASGIPGGHARIGRPGQWLEINWDHRLDSLGIWLTYGAWPQPGGHQEAAIEPTSSPANDLGGAIAAGAAPLAPGERRGWQVTLAVTD